MAENEQSGSAVEIRCDEIAGTRVVPAAGDDQQPAPGEALLRVDSFALTANNVTYAVMGEAMNYWRFFPASEEGWGRVPVWGFADVLASSVEGLDEGARIYGYLPMATHLVVRPENIAVHGFTDGAPHRAELPGFYNRYTRTDADPGYDPAREAEQMLLRPLFATSFLIDDLLADEGFHGARSVVLSSASSKTAYGVAFLLSEREDDIEVVGLTSTGNAGFVRMLGCYDRVVTYDELGELAVAGGATYVDMSGDAGVRTAVHHRLGDDLKHDLAVGFTHHDAPAGGGPDLPGPAPTFFFAPGRGQERAAEWGQVVLLQRIGAAWERFLAFVVRDDGPAVLNITRASGADAVQATWRELVSGRTSADAGHVLSLHED